MVIICTVSSAAGHLDFGGMGFLKVARMLEERGHKVIWLTSGPQVQRLLNAGCIVEEIPALNQLRLPPSSPSAYNLSNKEQHLERINSVQTFLGKLEEYRPGFILIDRLFSLGGLAADRLNIPYASIGTPGGYWRFDNDEIFPEPAIVNEYCHYIKTVAKELRWSVNSMGSGWLYSPYLNIHFMGNEFYFPVLERPDLCANINHYKPGSTKHPGDKFGLSFGNQGNKELLLQFINCLLDKPAIPLPIEVFAGSDENLYIELKNKYGPGIIRVHKWVDFGDHFSELRCLTFLGGVGTIWQCVDNALPMLIVPGGTGDQSFNALRVQSLNMGVCLPDSRLDKKHINSAVEKCYYGKSYRNNIISFRSPENYSDTLTSICERIENMCVM